MINSNTLPSDKVFKDTAKEKLRQHREEDMKEWKISKHYNTDFEDHMNMIRNQQAQQMLATQVSSEDHKRMLEQQLNSISKKSLSLQEIIENFEQGKELEYSTDGKYWLSVTSHLPIGKLLEYKFRLKVQNLPKNKYLLQNKLSKSYWVTKEPYSSKDIEYFLEENAIIHKIEESNANSN